MPSESFDIARFIKNRLVLEREMHLSLRIPTILADYTVIGGISTGITLILFITLETPITDRAAASALRR